MAILTVISMAAFLSIADGTVVALALPAIGRDLGAGVAGLAWVPNAYVVTYTALLATAGTVGDRFGRRPVFLAGMALFAAGSSVCAIAPSIGLLILGRVVQGAGGAAMLTLALAHISIAFPDRREWALGIYVTFGSLGGVCGPLLGGAITQFVGWRNTFWLLAVLAGISLALGWMMVADSRGHRRRPDLISLFLIAIAVISINTGLLKGGGWGWLSTRTLATAGVAVVASGMLLAWKTRTPALASELRQFVRRDFLANTMAGAAGWFAIFAVDIYTSLYLQKVLGVGALLAGFALAVSGATGGLAGLTVGRAASRIGRDRLLIAAMIAMSALLVPWLAVSVDWPLWTLFLLLAALGIPFTYVLALSAAGAMGGLPPEQAGVGAATFNSVRQIGSSLGVALPAAALLSGASAGALEIPSALPRAFAAAFFVRAVVFALATIAVTAVLLWPPPAARALVPQLRLRGRDVENGGGGGS